MGSERIPPEAVEAAKEKAREWNVCDPPSNITPEAAKQIAEAAFPFLERAVAQSIAETLRAAVAGAEGTFPECYRGAAAFIESEFASTREEGVS